MPRRGEQGFTLVDLAVATAALGILGALAAAGLARMRGGALLEECKERQREISAGSAQFALANQDVFAGFTWELGNASSLYADLRLQAMNGGVLGPHAAQAVDFWRRRGRTDMAPMSSWFPDNLYATTALVEFLGKGLTEPFAVCPGDAHRLAWRANPMGFDQGLFMPMQPAPSASTKRWPYSSSYLLSASGIDRFQTQFTTGAVNNRLSQQTMSQGTFLTSLTAGAYGPSMLSTVAQPSLKVFAFDQADRHFAPGARYFSVEGAVLSAAFFDGSVRVARADQGNRPWISRSPEIVGGSESSTYSPQVWEPTNGLPPGTLPPPVGQTPVVDPFRYTRDGLLGWDFPVMSRAVRGTATPGSGPG